MIKNQSLNSFDYCLSCRIQITKTIRKQGELFYSCEIFSRFLLLIHWQKIDNIQSGASQSTFRGCYNSDIFTKNVDKQTFLKHVKNICGEEMISEQGRVSTDNFGIKLQAEWCSENMRLWDWTTVQDMSDANNNLLNYTSKGVRVRNTLKKVCQNKSQ